MTLPHNRYFHLMAKPSSFHCNIKCEYCFYLEKEKIFPAAPSRPRQYMNDDVLENYIRQYIQANDSPEIHFAWQGGEPTLMGLPFFEKVVALQKTYAGGKTLSNSFQTNGIMLNAAWCEFFRRENFLIGISVDGLQSVHDEYRVFNNGAPTFQRVAKALQLLRRHEVEFNTLTVVNNRNYAHGRETYLALKELGAVFMQFIPIVETHAASQRVLKFSVPPQGYGEFLMAIFAEWIRHDVGTIFVNEFDALLAQWLGYPSQSCIHAEYCGDAMVIESNGDIYSCDHFVTPENHIGNLLHTPLRDIVQSAPQLQFGRDKKDGLTTICQNCEVRHFCHGGCPKDRIVTIAGEAHRHNYLCPSYKMFYHQSAPLMRQMAAIVARGGLAADIMNHLPA